MEKTSEKSGLIAAVKDFERWGMAWAMRQAKDERRIIFSLRKRLRGKVIDFEVMIKEVNGTPKFATFVFHQPTVASFTFFSYDGSGRRYFNRKMFDRMYEYLDSGFLIPEFKELITAERFE